VSSGPDTLSITIQISTLIAIVVIGAKIFRHANLIEFRVDQMWAWFQREVIRPEERRQRHEHVD
jgi:hypothetical protein